MLPEYARYFRDTYATKIRINLKIIYKEMMDFI